MAGFEIKRSQVTAARRGQIVQRVLVDGWSIARAAAACGIGEREVARWVAAYRRHGMASLRRDSAAARRRRWLLRLRLALSHAVGKLRSGGSAGPAPCVVLRPDRGEKRRRG